jgi:hypothetical protein
MTILPARTLKEWIVNDPIGSIMTIVFFIAMLIVFYKFWLNWQIMNMNLSQICIGGACK